MVQVQQQVHHGPRGVELESSRAGSRQMLGLGDSGGAAAAVAEQAHLIAFSASSSWEASAGSCCFSAAAAGPCWAACSCCSSSIAAGTREGSFATCGANTGSQISYWHSWSRPRTCSGARGVTTLPARAFLGPEAASKTYHTVLQVLRNATRPPGCCRAAPPARQRVHASPMTFSRFSTCSLSRSLCTLLSARQLCSRSPVLHSCLATPPSEAPGAASTVP